MNEYLKLFLFCIIGTIAYRLIQWSLKKKITPQVEASIKLAWEEGFEDGVKVILDVFNEEKKLLGQQTINMPEKSTMMKLQLKALKRRLG